VQSYKDGVVDLKGPGTTTSDSIPAWLSRGETVVPASSTAPFKDELRALNTSPLDYTKLLRQKYIEPAVDHERKQALALADNIARSLAIHNAFNDKNIVKELREVRKSNTEGMSRLGESIEGATRKSKFESRLYKSA
jgi:hypothetical protein